ncbi:yersiniabactin siderophore biosynthetic protein [Yersinia rohdei]|uniref:ANL family adenylate-forming protein n=1 Tax=Yersinia rohdei TaxID=29485 RepID=UPI0005E04697|nr:fatty acid--CoA ligase family protein [Yersinia rohdei]CNI21661.1 yersiniabactin siderophore biosynthetic protein [Yersinia rohdei]
MKLLAKLAGIWNGVDHPFIIHSNHTLRFSQITAQHTVDLSLIKTGDVVALIGDFNPPSILTLLHLIDLGAIIVPLTNETTHQHTYFFESALVDILIKDGRVTRIYHHQKNSLIDALRAKHHAGLILFSSGTTGRPKAILHDLSLFLKRFDTPRPAHITINFLLFDHIGGINTLFHTLFNKGVIVVPEARKIDSVLAVCKKYAVEVLPTTPTFLRLMLISGAIPGKIPASLKIITYGTERMDQPTLDELCQLLPLVDFRQTFGMSELGIVRTKSERRDSLFIKIGGEGVETKVVGNVLQIRSQSRMLGYLNAPNPFDDQGWYDTKDVVEIKDQYYKVTGRISEVINVGGLKFMASEVERVALNYPNVALVKAYPQQNPITGQHVELLVQQISEGEINKNSLMAFLKEKLPPHMVPMRIHFDKINIGHRFKK